jgi:hypothetical protein
MFRTGAKVFPTLAADLISATLYHFAFRYKRPMRLKRISLFVVLNWPLRPIHDIASRFQVKQQVQ